MYDFIMVGAGITGLELSALLSHDGYRGLVLERAEKIGGRAHLWKKDGWTVDYGIHLIRFGPESAISKICRHLGHRVEYIPLGKSFVYDEDDKIKVFPTGPGGFLFSKMFSFGERLKAIKLMAEIKKRRLWLLKETSVEKWMNEHRIGGGLRRYFILVSASMMVCPFVNRSSAGEMLNNIRNVLKTGYSVMYPKNGWEPLFNLYLDNINKNCEIQTKSKVDSIIIESGRARGVKIKQEIIEAKNIITCVPVQELFSGLFDADLFAPDVVDACRNQRSTSGVVIDFGLKKRISDSTGLWYLWDPMSFGIFTSNIEPSLAPEGKQLLTWLYPTETEDMIDSKKAKEREEELLTALIRIFPDLKKNIDWKRAMHLKVVDGTEVNVNQYKEKRIGPWLPGVDNLFLVGDSTAADGAGGDVGHESVLECYRAITGKDV